jgi:hypothetical protein
MPYRWSATVRYLSPFDVEVLGAMRAPTPSEWRAICQVLRDSGVTIARFIRRRADGTDSHDAQDTHIVNLAGNGRRGMRQRREP